MFFNETHINTWEPRAICVGEYETIQSSGLEVPAGQQVYLNSCGNNWAKGHYTDGKSHLYYDK